MRGPPKKLEKKKKAKVPKKAKDKDNEAGSDMASAIDPSRLTMSNEAGVSQLSNMHNDDEGQTTQSIE